MHILGGNFAPMEGGGGGKKIEGEKIIGIMMTEGSVENSFTPIAEKSTWHWILHDDCSKNIYIGYIGSYIVVSCG